MANESDHAEAYSEEGFWSKVKDYALRAGAEVIEKALILYYTAQDKNTPQWAKATIFGALGYFILPIDAIPDIIAGIGYTDDLGVLVMAFATVAAHITPESRQSAKKKIADWFGDLPPTVQVEGANPEMIGKEIELKQPPGPPTQN
jgi:uncharacterized membrane protein YkvA (DUF1232 family)